MCNVQRVDDILEFIAEFTIDIEGVGHVCRLVIMHPVLLALCSVL